MNEQTREHELKEIYTAAGEVVFLRLVYRIIFQFTEYSIVSFDYAAFHMLSMWESVVPAYVT